jgi:hypothetical protein
VSRELGARPAAACVASAAVLTEDPAIGHGALVSLLEGYGIEVARLDFLPIGADGHNYRAQAAGGGARMAGPNTGPARWGGTTSTRPSGRRSSR